MFSSFLVVIVFFLVISAMANKKKQNAAKNDTVNEAKSAKTTAAAAKTSVPPVTAKTNTSKSLVEDLPIMNASSVKDADAPDLGIMQPDIKSTVATSVRVSPHNHEGMFEGSLHADNTGEGKDPCHDELYDYSADSADENAERNAKRAKPAENEWVKAVVMSEILTRPLDRRSSIYGKR